MGSFFRLLLLASLSGSITADQDTMKSLFKNAVIIGGNDLEELKSSQHVIMVYFFTEENESHNSFYAAYDKSATYLESYNVKLAVYDCTSKTHSEPVCSQENVRKNVFTYQRGIELFPLEIDTIFDVDTIMANALQLVLIYEVPLIESRFERYQLQMGMSGKKDVIFAYIQALGIQEHRAFMEVAYTFQDSFKFALTTDYSSFEGLQDNVMILKPEISFAMWVLLCSEISRSKSPGTCRSVLYRGPATLSAMASFVQRLGEQTVFSADKDGVTDIFEMDVSLPVVYVYHDEATSALVEPVIDLLSFELRGFAKVVSVDMDNEDCKKAAVTHNHKISLPGLSIKIGNSLYAFDTTTNAFTTEKVQDFLVSYVFPNSDLERSPDEEVLSTDLEALSEFDQLVVEVETQDDQIADSLFQTRFQVTVPALFKVDFNDALKSSDLKMVLFYLTFDHVGMAFLKDFCKAADVLASDYNQTDVLARVNCFDASDLCAAENITIYPTLRIYKKTGGAQDYLGPLDASSVVTSVYLLQLQDPIMLMREEDVKGFLAGIYPIDFTAITPASVVLVADAQDKDVIQTYITVAKKLSYGIPFAYVSKDLSQSIAKKYQVSPPTVITHNRKDQIKPIRTLSENLDENNIKEFVKYSTVPVLSELTVSNFPLLYAKKLPLTILFVDKFDEPATEKTMDIFSDIAKLDTFSTTVFCWINAEEHTLGLKLLHEYSQASFLPILVVLDHKKSKVYTRGVGNLKLEDISNWLSRVLDGQEAAKQSLKVEKWGPQKRHFDFLSILEKELGYRPENSIFQGDPDKLNGEPSFREAEEPDPATETILEMDKEIRAELLEMRRSRLSSKRSHQEAKKDSQETMVPKHDHNHIEL